MSDITPEMLKVIAEGMGYDPFVHNGTCYAYHDKSSKFWMYKGIVEDGRESEATENCRYNPHTNNDQMVEIMKMVLHNLKCSIYPGFDNEDTIIHDGDNRWLSHGKTLNEAICKAAYEYFKED